MQSITIRPATVEDLDSLNRFQQAIVSTERSFDCTIKEGPVHYYDIADMLSSESVHFVVAAAGDVLVGCGFARVDLAKAYLKHSRHGYLGMMYTDPDWRGQSVNRRIVDALKQWCASQRVTELRLEVYADNRAATRAYEKSGFRGLMIEMRLAM